MNIGPID